MKVSNLIGGKECLLSGTRFPVKSLFYDYGYEAPDAGLMDIALAIAKAREAETACHALSFETKHHILKEASRIHFSKEDIEDVVMMTGMPVTTVEESLRDIPLHMDVIPELLEAWSGTTHGKIGSRILHHSDLCRVLHPIDGIAYAVTPGNDPRIVPFLASWFAILGIPAVIKVSKNDLLISQRVIRQILEAGYPAGGLQIVCWNTADPAKKQLHYRLVDAAAAVCAFGSDNVINSELRFERAGESVTDHFSDKVLLRHTSGRASAIFSSPRINENVHKIVESSTYWPIGCEALKSVFDATPGTSLLERLREEFDRLGEQVGDPLDRTTKVGYADPAVVAHGEKRITDLSRLGLIRKITGEWISPVQTTPLLLTTDDRHSEFLSQEFSLYLLTLKKCATYDEAVAELNESAGSSHRLSVCIIEENEEKVLRTFLRAHHVKRMRHSFELDLLFHEGHDYLHKLTVPQIHRVGRSSRHISGSSTS